MILWTVSRSPPMSTTSSTPTAVALSPVPETVRLTPPYVATSPLPAMTLVSQALALAASVTESRIAPWKGVDRALSSEPDVGMAETATAAWPPNQGLMSVE
jgi:hypothetical protein